MANKTIMDLTALTSVDRAADYFEIADVSDSNASKRSTINSMLDLTSHPVGVDDTQTLTLKTLTAPAISSPVLSGTVTGTYTIGGTPTFPSSVVTLTGTQTLTNKTLTSPAINTATIVNPTITVDTISEYTAANGVSIDGMSIKHGKLNTNNSVVTANITDTAVTPAKLQAGTGSGWAWSTWAPTWANFTAGNATIVAKYIQTGKTVTFKILVTLGGTSAMGTTPSFTLPVTAANDTITDDTYGAFNGSILDSGTARYDLAGNIQTTTTGVFAVRNSSATYGGFTGITSAIPMTWAVNDRFFITGSYEAA